MGTYVVKVDHIEVSRNDCESEGEALDYLNEAITKVVLLSKSSIITLYEDMGKGELPRPVGFAETCIDHSRLEISAELTRWLKRVHKDWFYAARDDNKEPDMLYTAEHLENEGYDEDNEDEYNRVQKEIAQVVDLRGGLTKIIQLIKEPRYSRRARADREE